MSDNNYLEEQDIVNRIVTTPDAVLQSADLKSWASQPRQIYWDDAVVNIEPDRMVWIVRTLYPQGYHSQAGYYSKALVTTTVDAENGQILSTTVTGTLARHIH